MPRAKASRSGPWQLACIAPPAIARAAGPALRPAQEPGRALPPAPESGRARSAQECRAHLWAAALEPGEVAAEAPPVRATPMATPPPIRTAPAAVAPMICRVRAGRRAAVWPEDPDAPAAGICPVVISTVSRTNLSAGTDIYLCCAWPRL